ncbi:MAG: CRISPR-associated endonuclease Cas1 [Candidatus Bathyarchaeia archaeon]
MKAKGLTINLEGNGSYLGMEKGCFVVRDKQGNTERIPLFENEIGEIVLTSGNFISTGVLASCGFWNIPIIVKTRIAQYEALHNGKGITIAKTIVLSKIESQNMVLRKYGLRELDLALYKSRIEGLNSESLKDVRRRLLPIEGKASEHYYHEIFRLMPFKAENRKGWKAYDGLNNTFNLAYTLLKFRVYMAVLNAHLEPPLGFVHSEQFGKPSLVCDMMELYRYLIDDFLIEFSQTLTAKDFTVKTEWFSSNRLGKRQVLGREKTRELAQKLSQLFEAKVDIPRIKWGKSQTVETLINEEAYLLAKHLRDELSTWKPRLPSV